MADPQATLAIFAEVAVALAGFGRRSMDELSPLETRRLTNLFILSGLVLFTSLLGIALLHVDELFRSLLWRIGSAVIVLLGTPWLIWDIVRIRRLEKAEKAEVNPVILITFDSLTLVALALQIANVVALGEAWPFFLALVLTVAGAFQQFVLFVRTGIQKG